jgi:hypothetical protein
MYQLNCLPYFDRELLSTKETDVRGFQERLSAVSGNDNFDVGLDQLQVSLKKAQE